MTVTFALPGLKLTEVSVGNFQAADLTKFNLVDGPKVVGSDGREATFVNTESDTNRPMTARIGHYPKVQPARAGTPFDWRCNDSVRMDFYVTATDSETGLTYVDQGNVVISTNFPTRSGQPSKAMVAAALMNAITFYLGKIETGDLTLEPLDKLGFGLVSEVVG